MASGAQVSPPMPLFLQARCVDPLSRPCTAVKLVMVHESVASEFNKLFVERVSSLKAGLPWEDGVAITPLPETNKTFSMTSLIADAVGKGAKVTRITRRAHTSTHTVGEMMIQLV